MTFLRLWLLLVLLAGIGSFILHDDPTAQASLSGQCNLTYGNPYLSIDQYVVSKVSLACWVYHTRQVEVCIVTNWYGGGSSWHCYASDIYYGEGWSYSVITPGYWCDGCASIQTWYWAYDYSNGETWTGYGPAWDHGYVTASEA
jgi:hypothetical protein